MKTKIPKWSYWLKMTENERKKSQNEWDAYSNEGREIVEKVLSQFQEEYGDIPRLEISGVGVYHCGIYVLSVGRPLIFDARKIPESFLGIKVMTLLSDENIPKEFRVRGKKREFNWDPERYEIFVDNNKEKICRELGNPNMDRYDMLSALCGKDFNEYIQHCKELRKKRTTPSYLK